MFNCVGGFYRPTSGSVTLEGQPIHRALSSHRIARLGLVRTFQNVRLFKTMTVVEICWWPSMPVGNRLLPGLFKTPANTAAPRPRRWSERRSGWTRSGLLAGRQPRGRQPWPTVSSAGWRSPAA